MLNMVLWLQTCPMTIVKQFLTTCEGIRLGLKKTCSFSEWKLLFY